MTVLEKSTIKMLMMFSSVTPVSWDFRFLQTFGFLRLNPNPGLGRQELTVYEIKIIMVAGNNWERWQK